MNIFKFFRPKKKAVIKITIVEVPNNSLDLNKYHIINAQTRSCNKCARETPHCIKLSFADRTICAVPEYEYKQEKGEKQ